MTIEQMRYFIAVATYESFSEAAWQCHISQSSISKHIAAIENELNIKLFDRSKRKVTLTPPGIIFLEHIRQITARYDQMQKDIASCAFETGQTLSVGMHCLAMHYDTLPAIVSFKRRYPYLNLVSKHLPNWNIWDTLENRECNFGILYDDGIDLAKYTVLKLTEDQLVFVVPSNHELACRDRISILELKNYPMAFSRTRTQIFRIATQACYHAGFEPIIAMQDSFPEPLLSLLKIHEIGMLYLKHALHYYNLSELKIIELEENISIPLVLTHQAKTPMNPSEKLFHDFMKNYNHMDMNP